MSFGHVWSADESHYSKLWSGLLAASDACRSTLEFKPLEEPDRAGFPYNLFHQVGIATFPAEQEKLLPMAAVQLLYQCNSLSKTARSIISIDWLHALPSVATPFSTILGFVSRSVGHWQRFDLRQTGRNGWKFESKEEERGADLKEEFLINMDL